MSKTASKWGFGLKLMQRFAVPYWPKLFLILLVGTTATLLGLAQPYFTKLLIDSALLRGDLSLLIYVSLAMLAAAAASYALNAWSSYRYVQVSACILFDMRSTVYSHLQKLSPRFYSRTTLGEIVSRLNNDVGEIQRISADSVLALTSNALFFFGSIVILLYLNPFLSILTFVLLPFSIRAMTRTRARLESDTDAVRQRSSDVGSFLIETLMGMRTTVLMTQEDRELKRFRDKNDRFVDALLRRQLTSTVANLIPSAVLTVSTLLIFLIGGYQVITQSMTLGAFVAFMAYQGRLTAPIHNVMTLYTGLATLKVSVKRVMELLDAPLDVRDGSEALEVCAGTIEFRNVCFRHDRDEILRDLSFTIPAGSFAVILGASGAGKSSIANLIVRLFDPDSGLVLLDDHDIRKYRFADLRRKVVMVEQDPFLFNATIEENIRYGGEYSAPPWLPEFPPQTAAGDRGLSLSGGEKQRIGIARALARRPEVLILDEATSAMDPDLEKAVISDIRSRMKGRTVILITHRLYLASLADGVFHLDDGNMRRVEEEVS